jgi:hypothetical protein
MSRGCLIATPGLQASLCVHLPEEPGAGVGPVPFDRRLGNSEHLGGLLIGQAGEESQFHQFGFLGVVLRQLIQRLMQREELFIVHAGGEIQSVKIHVFCASAMAQVMFAAGVINQDAAHRLGGGGEEMRAVLPFGLVITAEAQPGFVHQSRGLQGLPGRLPCHLLRGQLAQFLIDQGQKLVRRMRVALVNAPEDDGEFVHAKNL